MMTKVNPGKMTTKFNAKDSDAKYDVAMPDGFDFNHNKPLRRKNFTHDALFFEHKAAEMNFKATRFRGQAAEAKALGSRADRAKAKKLQRLNGKMAELVAELRAQGVDTDVLLKGKPEAKAKTE